MCIFVLKGTQHAIPTATHTTNVPLPSPRRSCNQHMEEQPLAIAFSDSPGDGILEELVWDDEVFWGTIYRNLLHRNVTTTQLTARNNRRIEDLVRYYCPVVPAGLCHYICSFLHLHY